MSRRRFYAPPSCMHGGVAVLPSDQAHHLRDVLRLAAGDVVELFDGDGAAYCGVVTECGMEVRIGSLKKLDLAEDPATFITLASALIKSDKYEWVLQKGTELGVREFIPLETCFSEVRVPAAKIEARLRRWRRIAGEAAKQCRRLTIPEIQRPTAFSEFLAGGKASLSTKLLFSENASRRWDGALPLGERVMICIGPEGGWHPREVEAAEAAGFACFSLGPRILRAETAALAAVTLISFR